MKLRPLIYGCLLAPLVAAWIHAPLTLQLVLLLCVAITLETTLLRPLRRLFRRTQRVEGIGPSRSEFEIDALNRAVDQLERSFDEQLKRAHQEKQEIHELLSALPDPVLHFGPRGHLRYVNPAAEVALELHRNDLIGRSLAASWSKLLRLPSFAPEDPRGRNWDGPERRSPSSDASRVFEEPGRALLRRVLQAMHDSQDCLRVGPERVYKSLLIPMEDKEQLLLLRDITDLKRLEEVRQLFFSSISHELRTPLTIIKGFAVTVLDHPDLPSDMLKPLQRIDKESDRLTRLVNDLLDLSQIQTKRLSLELTSFDTLELLEEIQFLLGPLSERQGVVLHFPTPADDDPSQPIYADRDRLKQVLINLVDNAIKFTPAGGSVHVSACMEAQWWQLSVRDNGPGVSREELGSLFDHFFRGKHNRKITGSGLGLAIVKEIVELHQGSVVASLPEGTGLQVTVRLPRHWHPNQGAR